MGNALRLLSPPQVVAQEQIVAAFESNSEGIAIADHGRIVYANAAFADLFAYSPTEMVGKTLSSLRPNNHQCERRSSGSSSASQSGARICQYLGRRKDGSRVQIEASCSPFRAQGRNLLIVNVRDVSQRERRRVVRDSDQRFRAIFKAAPIGIVQCGSDGRALEINPVAERMLGCSRTEFRGGQFRDFLHPDDREKDVELFGELAKGERDVYEHEVRYAGKEERRGWMRLKVSLVRGLRGEPQFAIAMIEDITERKQAQQRLLESQKMEAVGRLVGGVAHDFNNLLTGITLYCDLLIAGLDPSSSLRRHAEEIRMVGEQGAALIQQLLAFSRQQPVEPRILCLNQVVHSSRNLLSRLLGEKIVLRFDLEKDLGNIKMDPAQSQQILFNLVLNAGDAISGSGQIAVETRNCGFLPDASGLAKAAIPGVLLSVRDTGCGMDEQIRGHLFEPFFTTKPPGRGNGLGLATVHNIVKSFGGSIEVQSEPGKGTTVRVLLPRIAETPAAIPGAAFSPVRAKETILLVEDNGTVRRAAQKILRQCGYPVMEAADGTEALAVAQTNPAAIDLLVADLVMPEMTGRELGKRVLELRPNVRILYMSGYEPQKEEEQTVPVVLFRKPFTGAALLEKVRQVLDAGKPGISKKQDYEEKREPLCLP